MLKYLGSLLAVMAGLAFATPVAGHPPESPPAVPPASTDTGALKEPTCKQMQAQLSNLGFNTAGVDGICGPFSKRAYSAFARLAGYKLPLGTTHRAVTAKLMKTRSVNQLRRPRRGGTHIEISLRSQTAFLVKNRRYVRIMPVSTGGPGFATPRGSYKIWKEWGKNEIAPRGRGLPSSFKRRPGWDYSIKYENTPLLLPMYFNGGIALHGPPSDDGVKPFFASHGCVRMLHKDIRRLGWHVRVGTPIYVI